MAVLASENLVFGILRESMRRNWVKRVNRHKQLLNLINSSPLYEIAVNELSLNDSLSGIFDMNVFQWTVAGTAELPTLNFGLLEQWLQEVARSHGKLVGDLNYVFCDDEEILRVNRQFLDHDYYTDIITFDRSGRGVVRGDMYISLDTVQSNAVDCRAAYDTELNRVVVHGLLHLCGINDKGPGEREIMERHEDEALSLLKSITTGNEV